MEVLRHSCIVNGPELFPLLRERSLNRRNDYIGSDFSQTWKHDHSSPNEDLVLRGSEDLFTGNLHSGLYDERSEEEIQQESARLWAFVTRTQKWRSYRERQPKTVKDKEQKWPDHMEIAFFKAIVRYPPIGRGKRMLHGRLHGRNELIRDYLLRETGVDRCRKQISSHLQVLKNFFKDVPEVMMYLASPKEKDARKYRHSSHMSQLRSRHARPHANQNSWNGAGSTLSGPQELQGAAPDAEFTLTDFVMFVQNKSKEPVHYFTQFNEYPRLDDLHVNNLESWHRQYPELAFHRTKDWQHCQVLVCDSSIRIMTEKLPSGSELGVQLQVSNPKLLALYEHLESRTRFYEAGKQANQFDDKGRPTSQTCSSLNHDPNAEVVSISIPFGSHFWACRMSTLSKHYRDARLHDERSTRTKVDMDIRRQLQYLTAVQEVYGTRASANESECLLTILWRFHQTKSTDDAGQTWWRTVRFRPEQPRYVKMEKPQPVETIKTGLETSVSSQPLYPALGLDFIQQAFSQPPGLHIEGLSTVVDGVPNFSNPQPTTAPSLATDFSQQSLSSLDAGQDTNFAHSQDFGDHNDIDFTGGQINICLEPAINLGAYESYSAGDVASIHALNPITGLDPNTTEAGFGEFGSVDGNLTPYAPKPWAYSDVAERLQGLVEQQSEWEDPGSQEHDIAGHGVLHGVHMDEGLWNLQRPFPEDTGVGPDARTKQELFSQEQERCFLSFGERGEKFRLF